jgi:hypothetical protein
MAKLAYAAWVNEQLSKHPEEEQQEIRKEYWSEHGRIVQYDRYVDTATERYKTYDPQPEGYEEYYTHAGHKAAGLAIGLLGVFGWFVSGIIGGASRNHF